MQCCDTYGKEQTLQFIPKLNKTQQHKMQESSWNHQEMQIQPFYTQFTPKTRLLLSFTLVSYSFFSSGLKRNTHTMLLLPLSNQKWWVLICMQVFSLDAQHAGARRQFPSSVLVSMGTFLLAPFPPHPVHHNSKHWLVLCRVRRWRAAFPVLLIRHFEHLPALQLSIQPGADEERAAHLTVERVRLLGGRGEPVFEHHGDEVVDPLGGGLGTEVEGLRGGKSLAEDHHCIHVGIHHCLDNTSKKTKN